MGPDAYRSLPEVLGKLRPARSAGATEARARRGLPVVERQALLDFNADARTTRALSCSACHASAPGSPYSAAATTAARAALVPYTRGSEKNREPEHILAEVRALAEQGTPEVVLLGQTVNSYEYGEWAFPDLLRAFARVDGIPARTLHFAAPERLHAGAGDEPWPESPRSEPAAPARAVGSQPHAVRRMLRRYTVESYLEKICRSCAARFQESRCSTTSSSDALPAAKPHEEYASDASSSCAPFATTTRTCTSIRLREGTPATRLPAVEFHSRRGSAAAARAGSSTYIALFKPEINRARARPFRRKFSSSGLHGARATCSAAWTPTKSSPSRLTKRAFGQFTRRAAHHDERLDVQRRGSSRACCGRGLAKHHSPKHNASAARACQPLRG